MNKKAVKGLDEKFCPECGAIIKTMAELCVHCGVQQIGAGKKRNSTLSNKQETEHSFKIPMIFGMMNIFFGSILFIYKIDTTNLFYNVRCFYYYARLDISFLDAYGSCNNDSFIIFQILYFIILTIMIISGIGLLSYREWGRKSSLIIAFCHIVLISFSYFSAKSDTNFIFHLLTDTFFYLLTDASPFIFSLLCIIFLNQKKFKDAVS